MIFKKDMEGISQPVARDKSHHRLISKFVNVIETNTTKTCKLLKFRGEELLSQKYKY